jgi:adenylate kinase
MKTVVSSGRLLPDEIVVSLLQRRLRDGADAGERGFILDGFPR